MSKLNKSVDDLGLIIAVVSFSMLSFLLVSLVNVFFERFANDTPEAQLARIFFYALAIALSYTFAKIHRSGVTELVGFKNVWHLIVIVMITLTTFQIEKHSIANGVTYLKTHILKNTENFRNSDIYKSAESKQKTAERALKFWQSYKGTEAERLMIEQLKRKYELAVKEKEFRLKNYKYATTKKADKQINEALTKIQKIEDRILHKRESKIAYYTKLRDEAIKQKESFRKKFKADQEREILEFSEDAKHWAEIIVTIMMAVYITHGLLNITSEENFTLKGFVYRLAPSLKNRHDEPKEPEAILKTETENVIKFEPKKVEAGYSAKDAVALGKLASAFEDGERVTKKQFAEVVGVGETTALSMMVRYAKNGVLRKVDGKYYYHSPTPKEETA